MNKLSLKMKLALGFGSLLLILACVGGTGYYATYRISAANETAVDNLSKSNLSAQMQGAIEKQTTGVRGFLLAGREDLLKHDQDGQAEYKEASETLGKRLVNEKGRKLFEEISGEYHTFRGICDKEIELRRAGKGAEAEQLAFSPQTTEVRTKLRSKLTELDDLEDTLAQEGVKEGNAAASG